MFKFSAEIHSIQSRFEYVHRIVILCILIYFSNLNRWEEISKILNTKFPKKDKEKNALREKHLAAFNSITLAGVKLLCELLEPLKQATDELEASKRPTLHLAHPWYHTILTHLQPSPLDAAMILHMKAIGLAYWTENVQSYITAFHDVAVGLHPEMKDLRLYTDREKTEVWKKVEHLMNNFSPRIESRIETEQTQPKKRTVSKAMQYFISERNDDEPPQQNELTDYKNLKLRDDVDSLLDWWEGNKVRFPRLYGVARFIHSIPASSAAAERLFSKAGRVVTFRPNMGAGLVDELLFLQSNIDMFNKLNKASDEGESNVIENDPDETEVGDDQFFYL